MEPAVVGRPEDRTGLERSNSEIGVKRLCALIREGDDALLAALRHIAGGEERDHLFARERLDDLLRHPHISKRREWRAVQIVGKDEPVEEAAHFAEIAVACSRGVVRIASQVDVEVGGLDPTDILRETFLAADSEEALKGLPVGVYGPR